MLSKGKEPKILPWKPSVVMLAIGFIIGRISSMPSLINGSSSYTSLNSASFCPPCPTCSCDAKIQEVAPSHSNANQRQSHVMPHRAVDFSSMMVLTMISMQQKFFVMKTRLTQLESIKYSSRSQQHPRSAFKNGNVTKMDFEIME